MSQLSSLFTQQQEQPTYPFPLRDDVAPVDILLVGGGGASGQIFSVTPNSNLLAAGGGGGGEVVDIRNFPIILGKEYSFEIGPGSNSAGGSGSDTFLGPRGYGVDQQIDNLLIARGGGGGAGYQSNPKIGGSGGGGYSGTDAPINDGIHYGAKSTENYSDGNIRTSSFFYKYGLNTTISWHGNRGGNGVSYDVGGTRFAAGGGGGAASPGGDGITGNIVSNNTFHVGGAGGAGYSYDLLSASGGMRRFGCGGGGGICSANVNSYCSVGYSEYDAGGILPSPVQPFYAGAGGTAAVGTNSFGSGVDGLIIISYSNAYEPLLLQGAFNISNATPSGFPRASYRTYILHSNTSPGFAGGRFILPPSP